MKRICPLGACLHGDVQSTAEPQIENLIREMRVNVNKLQITLEKNP